MFKKIIIMAEENRIKAQGIKAAGHPDKLSLPLHLIVLLKVALNLRRLAKYIESTVYGSRYCKDTDNPSDHNNYSIRKNLPAGLRKNQNKNQHATSLKHLEDISKLDFSFFDEPYYRHLTQGKL